MLKLLGGYNTGAPVSGIRTSRAGGKLAIVHGDRHKVTVVEAGVTATPDAGLFLPDSAGRPWSRVPYPLIERDGYITANAFDCSFAPDDRILYAVTPDTGIVSIEASGNTVVDEFGRPGEFGSVYSVPGEPGLVVAASVACEAGRRVPAHALVDLKSKRILARSRYPGPKSVHSPAVDSLVIVKDLQGATEVYFVPLASPANVYTTRLVLYTRPDGLAISPDGEKVALLEIDRHVTLAVLDLGEPSRTLVHRHVNPGERPAQALNLDLAAMLQDYVVIPKGDGLVVVLSLPSLTPVAEVQAHPDPVTGVGYIRSTNTLVTSSLGGDIRYWEISPASDRWDRLRPPFETRWLGGVAPSQPPPAFDDRELADPTNAGNQGSP